MMTCTSDRSGIASSGVWRIAYAPASDTKTVARMTKNLFRSDQSISFSSIVASLSPGRVRVLVRGRRRGHLARPRILAATDLSDRLAEVALRVDEELRRD